MTNGRRAAARAVVLACLASGPAGAVVGGREEAGPAARGSAMILSSRGGVCSAVVIDRDVLLTAGHCARGADSYRVHYRAPDGSPVLAEVAAVAVHPDYVPGAEASRRRSIDLALVRSREPLPSVFAPLALASRRPAAGESVTLGGWGVAREGDARSTGSFRLAPLAAVEPHGPGRLLLWLAPATDDARGACDGDSGGPVLDAAGGVVAVTSWATGQGGRRCGAFSQAVLVGPQRGWIDRVLAGWARSASWR